jgi:3-oxoacyl-ACP reductase-like protein
VAIALAVAAALLTSCKPGLPDVVAITVASNATVPALDAMTARMDADLRSDAETRGKACSALAAAPRQACRVQALTDAAAAQAPRRQRLLALVLAQRTVATLLEDAAKCPAADTDCVRRDLTDAEAGAAQVAADLDALQKAPTP